MKHPTSAQHHTGKHSAKSGHFVLSQAKGETISAVEGLTLTSRMRTTIQIIGGDSCLSSEQRRALVKETLRKK